MTQSSFTKRIINLLTASLVIWVSFYAQANETPSDVSVVETSPKLSQTQYQDWVLICSNQGENKRCHMQQTLSAQQGEQTRRVLQAIVTYQGPQRLLEIIVPLGVDLRPGLKLQVDQSQARVTPYVACNQSGCIGLLNLDDALWRQLRKGQKAKVTIRGVGQTETTVLAISLKGFTAAGNALKAD